MRKIKFGIIGCGRIAQRHAKHINTFGELVAVCDLDKEKAKQLAQEYSVNYYTDYQKLLAAESQIDVISVCTPNGLHAEHTIASLKAKKNVLCEKPMAIKSSDCKVMIEEAEKNNKKLFVVKQNRYNPPITAVKKILEKEKLGKIFNVQLNCFWNRNSRYYEESDWKGSADLDGGTLYTQFSHFLDLLLWMIGDVKDFQVMRKNFLHKDIIDFEDSGVLNLEFESGAIGTVNYTVNSFKQNMEGSLTIFGDKGTVKIGGQYLNVLEYQNIEDYEIEKIPVLNNANEYGFYQGSMSNHDKVYENVISVLNGQDKIATTGEEGLKVVKLIEDIYKKSTIV